MMSSPTRLLRKIEGNDPMCALCNQPVRLEDCKINEDGCPAHEECYVKKVCAAENPSRNGKKNHDGVA